MVGVVAALLVLPAAGAFAQEGGESVGGILEARDGDLREPVGGVRIVARLDGAIVGEAVTAQDGSWRIELAGPGLYEVELDVARGQPAQRP